MDYRQLVRFARQHGTISFYDSSGRSYDLPSGTSDSPSLAENADRFLWDGIWRSRPEMEYLIDQSERGLSPGCAECERLEKELIRARDRDRRENTLDSKHEMPALSEFKEHRAVHH